MFHYIIIVRFFSSFLFLFSVLCSRWSFVVDVSQIFSCPADHEGNLVYYYCWVNVEARSVGDVKNAAQQLLDERLCVVVGAHIYPRAIGRRAAWLQFEQKKNEKKRNKVVLSCPILSVSHIYSISTYTVDPGSSVGTS